MSSSTLVSGPVATGPGVTKATEPITEEDVQRVYQWLDSIPLSRPKKNIARDFSDGCTSRALPPRRPEEPCWGGIRAARALALVEGTRPCARKPPAARLT